jgi:hypothetical protein
VLKSNVYENIGQRLSLCTSDKTSSTAEFPLLTLNIARDRATNIDTTEALPKVVSSCSSGSSGSPGKGACLLGGSGGLAGGSDQGVTIPNTEAGFEAKGTAGNYGYRGSLGSLTMPNTLWGLLGNAAATTLPDSVPAP